GRYFFADFVASRIWSLKLSVNANGDATVSDVVEHTSVLGGAASANPSSFGQDAFGELYVVSYLGAVYRIRAVNPVLPHGRPRPAGATIVGNAMPRPANTALAVVSEALGRALSNQPDLALIFLLNERGVSNDEDRSKDRGGRDRPGDRHGHRHRRAAGQ